ncbi:FHA domain-containing protein [Kitasatospora sp. NBC_00240]|uniref:FHA domain-containing protein n=1 Tax=Kitasatospora sp. NBC_00240 TaxID=2903567 RepID=UPI002250B59C|nr:FHA domain-containing protein [Kitasatospora sp. NBC_00240]MCX5208766.1 FHA domain-containing protein [Kitasatospora sp. NBC_00240]
MAQLICSSCGLAAEDGDLVCGGCSGNLSRPAVARYPLPGPPPPPAHPPAIGAVASQAVASKAVGDIDPAAAGPQEEPRVCPHCGAAVPVPTNQVCVACQRMLGEVRPSRAAGSGERAADVQATRRDAPTVVLRIRFGAVERTVTPGSTLLLGRAPAARTTSGLLERYDNVSRQHATVGLEPDGTAWVRDEHSTNGTFVNGRPADAGARTPLRDGDELRLAADCTLGISVDRPGDGGRR